jgi:hypothetical protein
MFSTPGRRTAGWVILCVTAAAVILGIVAVLASIRQTQLEGTPTGRKLLASAERILDCTDPGDPKTGRPVGKCYRDGQERTANAVGDINRVIILAAACSAGLPQGLSVQQRENEIESCVIDRLAREARKP